MRIGGSSSFMPLRLHTLRLHSALRVTSASAALARVIPAATPAATRCTVPPVHDADLHEHETGECEQEEHLRILVPVPGTEAEERPLPRGVPRGENREESEHCRNGPHPEAEMRATLSLFHIRM